MVYALVRSEVRTFLGDLGNSLRTGRLRAEQFVGDHLHK